MDWEQLKQQIGTDPRRTLRFIAGFSLSLILLWAIVLLQAETGSGPGYVDPAALPAAAIASSAPAERQPAPDWFVPGEGTEVRSPVQPLVLRNPAADEGRIRPGLAAGNGPGRPLAGVSGGGSEGRNRTAPVTTAFFLIAGVAGWFFWLRRRLDPAGADGWREKRLSLLERVEISPGQSLSVVRVCGEYWVVGSGTGGMHLMKKMSSGEWESVSAPDVGPEPETADVQPQPGSFMTLLQSVGRRPFRQVSGLK